MKRPKVSIVTISYNQEKYIRQALESFIMQKTTFDFEVVISDDCSTDNTQVIIEEYARKYPTIFKPILCKQNIGAQANSIKALQAAKGEYIALCEGDDFWTDAHKLQKQVDFMVANQELALCFHPVRVFFENSEEEERIYPESSDRNSFNLTSLLRVNFIQTNSVMYRRQDYSKLKTDVLPGDWYLHLYHAQFGKIGFIKNVMSAYRRHSGGIWWQTTREGGIDEVWKKHGAGHMNLYVELLRIYGNIPKYRNIIDNHIAGTISALRRVDETNETKILTTYTNRFPEECKLLVNSLGNSIYKSHKSVDEINERLKIAEVNLAKVLNEKEVLINESNALKQEKEAIINSKTYKLSVMAATPYRKICKLAKLSGKK